MSVRVIDSTDFNFPGQTAVYHGKVRDIYTINDTYIVAIATDRISAFDVILPRSIPFKGQVLNQTATYFLKKTTDIAPNWLINSPDPNVSIGYKCEPFKVEMVIRGCLVGYSWRVYKTGQRVLCGVSMPDGLNEYDQFPEPIITPSTKADAGHDEDISAEQIVSSGLMTQTEFDEMSNLTRALFARGQAMAAERGLFLADTKYEFGKRNGKIYVIDEVHTPDSSRYFYADSYHAYVSEKKTELPRHLSKEFVREWLMDQGFSGQTGQQMPDLSDEFVHSVSERYIELFEQLTGQLFNKPDETMDPISRIEVSIKTALEQL